MADSMGKSWCTSYTPFRKGPVRIDATPSDYSYIMLHPRESSHHRYIHVTNQHKPDICVCSTYKIIKNRNWEGPSCWICLTGIPRIRSGVASIPSSPPSPMSSSSCGKSLWAPLDKRWETMGKYPPTQGENTHQLNGLILQPCCPIHFGVDQRLGLEEFPEKCSRSSVKTSISLAK